MMRPGDCSHAAPSASNGRNAPQRAHAVCTGQKIQQ